MQCVAKLNSDCQSATICRKDKACRAADGMCIDKCISSQACSRFGRCKEVKQRGILGCVADNEKLCEASRVCKEKGFCSADRQGRCAAADDVDCGGSIVCQEQGRCSAKRGRCVASSDNACKRASVACKVQGRCRFDSGRCVK